MRIIRGYSFEVCNGHGPLGKLVAFRSAQSIPKLLLEAEATDASEVRRAKKRFSSVSWSRWSPVFRNATEASSEQLLARSVKFAAAELKKFAERNGYDLRHSGVENPNPNQLLWYFGGIKIEEL